jgi:threonine/homoserine/homoserine lactone efflux protein
LSNQKKTRLTEHSYTHRWDTLPMDVFQFGVTVILVTASGALAPGPLFFASVTHGAKTGIKSGIIFSFAHTIVEFSLIMLLAVGLITVASQPFVKLVIGIAGGSTLIAFGLFQIRNACKTQTKEPSEKESSFRHLFLIGLAITGLNPYFILWWLTVGAQLILLSLEFALFAGVIFMYLCHVWIDYVWYGLLSHLAKKGTSLVGVRWYRAIMGLFGGILIYFGITFLQGAINS